VKRLLSLLLCAVMLVSLLAACDSKQTDGNMENNAPPPPPAKLTIGLPVNAYVLDYKNNALTQYLEKEANCELDFIPYGGGCGISCGPNILPDDTLPDIIWGVAVSEGAVRRYARDGIFLDLSAYLANRDGASKVFWDRVEENYTSYEIEEIKRKMVDPNSGGIYFIPTLGTSLLDTMDYQAWINTAWLDNLGLPMPTDSESLYNTLVAFKTQDPNGNDQQDEIPIYGSEAGGNGADVINYLVNMFLYFDDRKHFSVDENGQLYAPFITEEYREAMQYINKLYAEKLIPDAVFTTAPDDLKKINSPQEQDGTARNPLVGVFCGDLNHHFHEDSPLLEQYEPLPYFKDQSVVFNDDLFDRNIFITKDCKNPDAAFKLIMKMFEEETSYRIRYGEQGVNWEYAPEGAVSDYSLPAKIKVIDDPIAKQNSCLWSSASGTLLEYLDGENVIWPEEATDWQKTRNAMSVQSRKNADAAAAANNPNKLCPILMYTDEELDQIEDQKAAVADYYIKWRKALITNQMNPYSDEEWGKYVQQVKDYGLDAWLTAAQTAYDRVPNI